MSTASKTQSRTMCRKVALRQNQIECRICRCTRDKKSPMSWVIFSAVAIVRIYQELMTCPFESLVAYRFSLYGIPFRDFGRLTSTHTWKAINYCRFVEMVHPDSVEIRVPAFRQTSVFIMYRPQRCVRFVHNSVDTLLLP